MKLKFFMAGIILSLFCQCKHEPVILNPDDVYLPVKINEQWGFINQSGNYIVYPKFEEVMPFSDGTAAVFANGKWGYIDTTGKYIIQPSYDEATTFSEGLAFVSDKDGNFICIDKKNNPVFTLKEFQVCRVFKEGLAAVCRDGKWGFIDQTGKVAIEPRYEKVSDFNGGFSEVVLKDEHPAFIDKQGKIQKDRKESGEKDGLLFVNGLALKQDAGGKYGYVNEKGHFEIKPVYDLAGDFKNEIAFVKVDGKIGFIDRKGKVVIEPRYEASYESCTPVLSLSKDILNIKEFVDAFLANSSASTFKGFSNRRKVSQILALPGIRHKGQALYVKNNQRLTPYATLVETSFYFNEDVMNINKNVKFNYEDGFNLADSVVTGYNEDVTLNGIEYAIDVTAGYEDQIPKIIRAFRHKMGGVLSATPVCQHNNFTIEGEKMRVKVTAPLSKDNRIIKIRVDFIK